MATNSRSLTRPALAASAAAALLVALLTARTSAAQVLVPTQVRISDPAEIAETGNDIAMSADGRFAVFSALVPSERFFDRELFLYDAEAGTAVAITSEDNGEVLQHADGFFAVSADGNTVAYQSDNLRWSDPSWFPEPEGFQRLLVFYDRTTGEKESFNVANDLPVTGLVDGGSIAVLEHESPGPLPAFFDRRTGEFTYLEFPSLLCAEVEAEVCTNHVTSASEDARFVTFSQSVNCFGMEEQCAGEGWLQRAYLLDRTSGDVDALSSPGVFASAIDVSDNGRYVLVRETRLEEGAPGTCRDLVHDRQTGDDIEIDFLPDGTKVEWFNCLAAPGRLSGDGRHVTLLLSPEEGAVTSVFVRDTADGETRLASIPKRDEALDIDGSYGPVVSDDGTTVAFISRAGNLLDDDEDAHLDAFVTTFAHAATPSPTPEFRLTVPNASKD